MICPNCKAEYVQGVTVCADCAVELEPAPRPGNLHSESGNLLLRNARALFAWVWAPLAVLVADALYVSYFWIWRADYYFPGAYEDAFSAAGLGIVVALVALLWLIARVTSMRRLARSSGKNHPS